MREYSVMNGTPPTDLAPTRRSLLTRLKNWDNQDSWREFFDTYWRLIYSFAIRSGLGDTEAQEVVQETLISVASELKGFKYDPARGSFKSWLLLITRRRVADQMRKRYRAREIGRVDPEDPAVVAELEARAERETITRDDVWDEQWRAQVAEAALAHVRSKVRPEQYQVFEQYVIHGQKAGAVARAMGVSLITVYLTKHRITALLKKEAERLEERMG